MCAVSTSVNRLPAETSSCDLSALSSHLAIMETKCHVRAEHFSTTAHTQHSKTHTSILLHTHTHSCTTGHLLSLSGLEAVDEYREDESFIQSSAEVRACYKTLHVRDYFLCQRIKCKINTNGIHNSLLYLTSSWLPALNTLTLRGMTKCEDDCCSDIMFAIFKSSFIVLSVIDVINVNEWFCTWLWKQEQWEKRLHVPNCAALLVRIHCMPMF